MRPSMKFLLSIGACLALVTPSGLAFARPPVAPQVSLAADNDAAEITLTVIHAKQTPGGVAPELGGLGPQLLKAFPNYKQFQRLAGQVDKLVPDGRAQVTLPNQAVLRYHHGGWKDGFAALELEVNGLKSTVNVKDGRVFFQAGRAFDGGMIVLAFKVARVP